MGSSWPLVGRDDELRVAVERCTRGGGVLLRGAAGIGKSRLAAEVQQRLGDAACVRIRATSVTSQVPLGAVAHLLDDDDVPDPAAAAPAMAAAMRSILARAPVGDRVTVRVDDVHLLDDLSASLLLQLALSGRAVLVLTCTSGHATPEPVDALWQDELVTRIDLVPLPAEAVDELLAAVLVGGIDGQVRRLLRDAAGGNLLYLRELVQGSMDSGLLTNARGHWELTGPLVAPERLGELVEQRLASLSPLARRMLESIALAEPIGTAAVIEHGDWHLVEELLSADMVVVVEEGRRRQLRPTHRLHAEVVLARMSEADRRSTLQALVAAVETYGCRRRDDARRLAVWQMEVGRNADVDALLRATRQALWDRDIELTLRCSDSLLQLDDLDPQQRLEAALLRCMAFEESGRLEEAEDLLGIFEPIAGTGRLRVELARCRASVLVRLRGSEAAAAEIIDNARAVVTDPELARELEVHRSAFAAMAGQVDRVLHTSARLVGGAQDKASCEAMLMGAVGHTLAGRSLQGAELAREGLALCHRLGGQYMMPPVSVFEAVLVLALADAGSLADALRRVAAAYSDAVDRSDRVGQGWLAGAWSRVDLLCGRPLDSLHHARESSLVFGEIGHQGARWALAQMAMSASHLGDLDTVGAVVEDLDVEPPAELSILDVEVNRGRIWGLVTVGRRARARTALAEIAGRARGMGQHALEAAVLHDVARLGGPTSVHDRLSELAHVVEGSLMHARVEHVQALVGGDGARLDRCAQQYVQLGCALFAAEAAAAAAEAHRRTGDTRAAGASEFVVRRLAAQCQGAETPAMRLTPAAEELTRREREVAELAATGLTNRQIADELVVSVRTVENHLQRAYAKVGVGSREELARVLGRLDPHADSG